MVAAQAVNIADRSILFSAPLGMDLFGGQWPAAAAAEEAHSRRNAEQDATGARVRLQHFSAEFASVTSDLWILSVVRHGYRLEFTAAPPPFLGIRLTAVPHQPAKRNALLNKVGALLAKNAVVLVPGEVQAGHYSSFFLTPKKSEEWRPIINLKPLNFFVRPQPFRVETLAAVLHVLCAGFWGAN